MTLTHFAIIAVCAYLLGSLSFAIIVSKLTLGKDIRNYGSGNAGLTNAYRTMGAKKTLLVLLGDIAKGAAAVSIGMVLGGLDTVDVIASVPTDSNDKPRTEQVMRTVYVETYGKTYTFTKLED